MVHLMVKDAADNPYQAQIRPFVLPCAECRETGRIYGLRLVRDGTVNTPYEPLCQDCTEIHIRVWGSEGLSSAGPPVLDMINDVDSGNTLYVVLCPRCNGSGMTPWGICNTCMGMRYSLLDTKGVRRTARWWQTYQQNRTDPNTG